MTAKVNEQRRIVAYPDGGEVNAFPLAALGDDVREFALAPLSRRERVLSPKGFCELSKGIYPQRTR